MFDKIKILFPGDFKFGQNSGGSLGTPRENDNGQ